MNKFLYSKSQVVKGSSKGFTLLELIIVLALFGIIAGAVIANYGASRPKRNLKIAQNELVTNLRKVQSYTLSARNLPGGQSAQYYIMKFDSSRPSEYSIYGVYNVNNPPRQLRLVETVPLPQGIRIANPVTIATSGVTQNASCVLVGFKLPFGQELVSNGCTGSPPTLNSADDFYKLVDFVTNNGGTVTNNSIVTITLEDTSRTISNQVIINGITGLIKFQ